MSTTTTTVVTPTTPLPLVSGPLALISGVVILVATVVAVTVLAIVNPSQALATDAIIGGFSVPAIAGLFLTAKVSYGSPVTNTLGAHTTQLSNIQLALNGSLDARIKTAVRDVLVEVPALLAALTPAAVATVPADPPATPALPTQGT